MGGLMPQPGETVSEGKILTWFKSVGETVASGENLCEVETDKVTIEVPALEGGLVRAINVEAGQTVAVGTAIAVIDSAPGDAVAPIKSEGSQTVSLQVSVNSTSTSVGHSPRRELDSNQEVRTPIAGYGPAMMPSGLVASPLARRLAAVHGIDLSTLTAGDPSGRIKRADVERAAAANQTTPARALPPPKTRLEVQRTRPHKVVRIDRMREIIAERLTLAKTSIP